MMHAIDFTLSLVSFFTLAAVSSAQTCNPITGSCKPNVGLPTSTYSIDFTQQTAIPKDWTLSDWSKLNVGAKGAEFTINQRYASPQLWSNFYIFFGRVETVLQAAPGTGIVSSAVLMSDDADEIDWEFSGNNFGDTTSTGKVQNNYYGKGITGAYDRSQTTSVNNPQTQFHTYTVDWAPDKLTWSVDGVVIRTLYAANGDQDTHQYPQTPAKVQLGVWAGGDPGNAWGTIDWAGGYTDFTKIPFTMYVKSVKITNYNPAYAYYWTDTSGSKGSIQLIQQSPMSSLSTTVKPSTSIPSTSQTSVTASSNRASTTSATHSTQNGIVSNCNRFAQAVSGDYCSKFASSNGITTQQLYSWNPVLGSNGANCDMLFWANYDYCVGVSSTTTTATIVSSSSTTQIISSNTGKLSTTNISPSSIVPTDQANALTTVTASSSLSSATASISVLSCPSSNNTIHTASTGAKFLIECGIDHQAGDMGNTSVRSLEGCIEYCAARGGCVDVSLSGSACYIKNSLGTAVSNAGVLGAKLVLTTASSSSMVSNTPSSTLIPSTGVSQASSSTPSSATNSAASNYALYQSSDSDQGSYTNIAASSSYTDCITACDQDSKCNAFTYSGGNNGLGSGTCWLKTTLGSPVSSNSNVLSGSRVSKGSVVSSSITTTTTSTRSSSGSTVTSSTSTSQSTTGMVTCPSSNNTIYTDPSSNQNFLIECGIDHAGGDMNMLYVSSFASCISTCASTNGCVDVAFTGAACYLKSTVGDFVHNGGVQGAKLVKTLTKRTTNQDPPPPVPLWARYLPRDGRWQWNGHGD